MPLFEDILTPQIKAASVITKSLELVIPHPEVLRAVELATEAAIAVLGVELFEIVDDGFLVKNYSGYEITDNGNWNVRSCAERVAAVSLDSGGSPGNPKRFLSRLNLFWEHPNLEGTCLLSR